MATIGRTPPTSPTSPPVASPLGGSNGASENGADLLLSDGRYVYLFINEARYRALARLFGVPRQQANLLTFVIALTLAQSIQAKLPRLLHKMVPSGGDSLLAFGSLREWLCRVGGPGVRDSPGIDTLLTVAVLTGTGGPSLVRAVRDLHAAGHLADLGFHHRYGYIVDPGHWRARYARQHGR